MDSSPTAEEVREQLDRLLLTFSESRNRSALLRTIVEKTLSGEAQDLKERWLGVEVFRRPADYDTGRDSIVRTEASKVRRLLTEYYAGPGAADRVLIELPAGGYVPRLSIRVEPEPLPVAPAPAAASRSRRWPWAAVAAMLALLVLLAAIAIIRTPEQEGESAWWRFDETGDRVIDVSRHGNDGRLVNGVTRSRSPFGGALDFDGIGGHVAGLGPGSLPSGDSPRTIAAWVRCARPPATDTNLLHWGEASTRNPANNFHLLIRARGIVAVGNGYGHGIVEGNRVITDGAWHHVAGAYYGPPGNKARVFVDGHEDSAKGLSAAPKTRNVTPWTAGLFMAGGTALAGSIADLRVYSRGLSRHELAALYRCTSPDADVAIPGERKGYFIPFLEFPPKLEAAGPGEASTSMIFEGMKHDDEIPRGAYQFAAVKDGCPAESLHGALIDGDFDVSAELLVQSGGNSHLPEAGPFVRASPLRPGDAFSPDLEGVWIALSSSGSVAVRPLRTVGIAGAVPVTRSRPVPGFDDSRYHKLTAMVRGNRLSVALDAAPVIFAENRGEFALPSAISDAAAGVAFAITGKPLDARLPRARNIVIARPAATTIR